MGQSDVLNFFEKHPDRWFTSFEIKDNIGISHGSVTTALRKLRKYDLIEYEEKRVPALSYIYRAKK